MSLARVFCSWSIATVLLLLSIAFSNSAESEKTLDPVVSVDGEAGEEGNGTANVTLTGNPQIDYVHDPNLPRELNGYNLSDYPFYNKVPKNINFSCDGRKDGFYASVEHKCQIYHHCLFGNRFDFICANYTAFDQRTFICQFVSDVDCPNSHMYFHRNKDLYVSKSTTTAAPLVIDRGLYGGRRPSKKHKSRFRPSEDSGNADTQQQSQAPAPDQEQSTAAPGQSSGSAGPAPPAKKDLEDQDYYDDDYDYPQRRPVRPRRRPLRKCRGGRRRGRRCRPRRPPSYYYDDDDYAYDDDYDYAYYDDVRPRKPGKKRRRPLNAIPAGTSQTSSSETPPPTSSSTTTTTTTTTTEPPIYSTSSEMSTGPLDSESIAVLQKQRDELLSKTRRPHSNFRVAARRPSIQNDKSKATSSTTTSTTTEKARPSASTSSTTTEIPQYVYDYEYYEDPMDDVMTTTTSTTTQKPYFRGKLRGGNSAAAFIEKQRVQQSVQVRITEDQGTNTNTIRRRDNSNVQTPGRAVTPSTTTTTTSTSRSVSSSTPPVSRPARFWQRKSTVKSISTTTSVPSTTTTTTTEAPAYYQEYQDEYEDDLPPSAPSAPSGPPKPQPPPPPPPSQQSPKVSTKYQPFQSTPQHQYGTSSVAAAIRQPQSYSSNAQPQLPSSQQSMTSSRGGGVGGSGQSSGNSYAVSRPNKHYSMQQQSPLPQSHHQQQQQQQHQQPQQYSQSSSSTSSISSNSNINSNSNSNSNYNTNSYHRQRSPPQPVIPKPEFISLVDEDYNNPYSPVGGSTSPSSPPLRAGGAGSRLVATPGYLHQHPIRFFEQHQAPAFLFGAASEYAQPQFAFPPRNYPSPSNFQPYGHSTRRFSSQMYQK